MNDIIPHFFKKVLSTTLVITLLSSSLIFSNSDDISKNKKLMPSGDVVEFFVKLKYPLVLNKLNSNKTLKKSDVLLSIKIDGKQATLNRETIEKTMESKDLPLQVVYCRNGKVKKINITSDDLRDFEFGYYSFYLGTITAVDAQGNFIALSHNLKDENTPFEVLDNGIFNTSYVQTRKNTIFRTGNLVASGSGDKIGTFNSIGDGGMSGKFDKYAYNPSLALDIGSPKVGTAYLYCKSPVSNKLKMHEIEIVEVGENFSFIKIIDEDLLKYRGGIVQGMSGSPIIQNNKLVGGTRAVIKYKKSKGLMTNIDYMIENSSK